MKDIRIAIRVDASIHIGTGHVMRCMVLANALRDRGAIIHFICRECRGDLIPMLREAGFSVSVFAVQATGDDPAFAGINQIEDAKQTIEALGGRNPDWLVVDNYDLDFSWEKLLRPKVGRILVIDDLANRNHECDVLLDQNDFIRKKDRYNFLLPIWCTQKLGSTYFLLRPEFKEVTLREKINASNPERLFLFFGGSDPCDVTSIAIEALLQFDPMVNVDVVVGAANPNIKKIKNRCALLENACLHRQTGHIAQLMAGATLALGAGGITTYERLAVGLYAITVASADNQVEPLKYLAVEKQITYLGLAEQVSVKDWIHALSAWREGMRPQVKSQSIGSAMCRLTDLFFTEIRRFGPEHIESTFNILADSAIREAFAMTDAPTYAKHRAYWDKKITDLREYVFALHFDGQHIGNLGIKPVYDESAEYEGWIYLRNIYGRGFGEFAFRQLIKYVFCDLQLSRLIVHVLKDNNKAISLYRKIGFRSTQDTIDTRVWGEKTTSIMKMELCA